MYSHLEDFIINLYHTIGIMEPKQLDMYTIAERLGISITYRKSNYRLGSEVILSPGNTKQKEWQLFGHEVGHVLRHSGQQLGMHWLFIELQEFQANHFSYHFCVPTFMLRKLELPFSKRQATYQVAKTFNVEYGFASKRLGMFESKMVQELYY